ncbi:mitochondrial ATPase inhibitor, IATP-domain-containing protein [Nemania sp. FL0916]|nr:mitochondrial ATPase inhibitor, IATP-domain-containing protein [Nemania sp. FL0916]
MYRQALIKTSRGLAAPASTRTFSTTLRAMSEGDTGAPPKMGGTGDAFQRREKASEDYAIRQRERAKLLELRQKIDQQQEHLKKLSDHM